MNARDGNEKPAKLATLQLGAMQGDFMSPCRVPTDAVLYMRTCNEQREIRPEYLKSNLLTM